MTGLGTHSSSTCWRSSVEAWGATSLSLKWALQGGLWFQGQDLRWLLGVTLVLMVQPLFVLLALIVQPPLLVQ